MKIRIINNDEGIKLAKVFDIPIVEDLFYIGYGADFIDDFSNRATIDLSTSEPCIYQCMKQEMKISIQLKRMGYTDWSKTVEFDFSSNSDKQFLFEILEYWNIESINILGLEEMSGVEVIDEVS